MTVHEFDAQQRRLACAYCKAVGALQRVGPGEHNQIRVDCTVCGKRHALGSVLFLSHAAAPQKRRKAYPMGKSPAELWPTFKHRCAICGQPQARLFKIGGWPTVHHVTERYDENEYDCPVIPICSICKPVVDLQQRQMAYWLNRVEDSTREPIPPGGTGVPETRLSPDPVRPEREAPAGPVEELSDDYAHR